MVKLRVGKHFVVLSEPGQCDCERGVPFADGQSLPEYTSMITIALKRALVHIERRDLYWASHNNGRHILDVKDAEGKSLGR